jgi:hypothetical protein
MKYLKVFGLALVAVVALGVSMASSAFALPDLSVTLGEGYPLHIQVTLLTVRTHLSNVVTGGGVEELHGEGLLLLFLTFSLTDLGTFEALFTKVQTRAGVACKSSGDPSEEVLTLGTFHIVWTSLRGSARGLTLGELFLPLPFMITCGAKTVNIQGSVLSSLNSNRLQAASDYTQLGGLLQGNGEGEPKLVWFYNESGNPVKAKLEANFGSGFRQSAEEVEEEVVASSLGGKMFAINNQ